MGVIYSSQEYAEHRVPTTDSHEVAANMALAALTEQQGLALAVVHGSVVDGRSNARSDLDLFIEYEGDDISGRETVKAIGSLALAINQETYVRTEATVWPFYEARQTKEGRFSDVLFSRYLSSKLQSDTWRVGSPDREILQIAEDSYQPQTVRRAIVGYMAQKHNSFLKAPAAFTPQTAALSALQRCMELPKMVSQKADQLSDASGGVDIISLDDSGVLQGVLYELRTIDQTYTDIVYDQTDSLAAYETWLQDVYPKSIKLGLLAISVFNSLLPVYFDNTAQMGMPW